MYNLLNELFILQNFLFILLIYFSFAINIFTLWYLAGLYLISSGILLLINDGDIFVGFLWVVDLGVGLIFFIFILHFSNFLYQKSQFFITEKFLQMFLTLFLFIWFFLTLLALPVDDSIGLELKKSWNFLISWYDYYELFFVKNTTDLNILRELYFYNNSFEFFIANFAIFYGIFSSIVLSFLIKRIFNFLIFDQINSTNILHQVNSIFFIRNQNFIKQQNTSAGTRVWIKNKSSKF